MILSIEFNEFRIIIQFLGCTDNDRYPGSAGPDSYWDIPVLLNKPWIEQAVYDGVSYELTSFYALNQSCFIRADE